MRKIEGSCAIPGCQSPLKAKGLCHVHRMQEYHAAHPRTLLYRPTMEERFWAKVDKSGDCWLWMGARIPTGYGHFLRNPVGSSAHRYSYYLATGVNPGELHVLHRCDNPPCVNPDHLFLGTHRDNMADRTAKARTNALTGERHWNAKVTTAQVAEIRRLRAAGWSCDEVGLVFGIKKAQVSAIATGRVRKAG